MHKHVRSAVAVSAALVAVGVTAPAATAAPKLPAGCTFDGATGTTTCTTSTVETTKTETSTRYVGDSVYDDSSLFFVLCKSVNPATVEAQNVGTYEVITAVAQTTTVTTTSYQGVATGKGNKPISTTSKTTKTISLLGGDEAGQINCAIPGPFGGYVPTSVVYPPYTLVVG